MHKEQINFGNVVKKRDINANNCKSDSKEVVTAPFAHSLKDTVKAHTYPKTGAASFYATLQLTPSSYHCGNGLWASSNNVY